MRGVRGRPVSRLRPLPGPGALIGSVLPHPGYAGWKMAGMGFFCAALSAPGQSYALAFYLEPLMAATGLSRVEISSVYSGATLGAAMALPLLGRWADGSGGGRFLGTILLLLSGGMLLLGAVGNVWVLVVALLLLRMLGQGAVGLGTLTLMVRWFERHQARALAVVALGFASGEMIFPGAIVGLSEAVGWRGSLMVFAGAYALLFAPLVFWAGRDPQPDERRVEAVEPVGASGPGNSVRRRPAESYSLGRALRTPVFWGLTAVLSIPPLVMTAVFLHHVALLGPFGWGPAGVARAMVAVAVGGLLGTYAGGMAFDRFPVRFGIGLALGLLGAGLLALVVLPPTPLTLLLYGLLLGLSAGTAKVAGSVVWPTYFGPARVGSINGAVTTIRNAASAAGPPLAALLAGPSEAFERVLVPFAGVCLAGAVASVFLRAPVGDQAVERAEEEVLRRAG